MVGPGQASFEVQLRGATGGHRSGEGPIGFGGGLECAPSFRSLAPPFSDAECGPNFRSLVAAGMCVGAHTLSHPVLSQLSPEDAWEEISASRCRLQETVDKPVWALAYPFGDAGCVTDREREMAQRAGFKCAFLNVGGGFGAEMPRFALPRVHVTGEMNLGEFEAHVSGFYRALRGRFLRAS